MPKIFRPFFYQKHWHTDETTDEFLKCINKKSSADREPRAFAILAPLQPTGNKGLRKIYGLLAAGFGRCVVEQRVRHLSEIGKGFRL